MFVRSHSMNTLDRTLWWWFAGGALRYTDSRCITEPLAVAIERNTCSLYVRMVRNQRDHHPAASLNMLGAQRVCGLHVVERQTSCRSHAADTLSLMNSVRVAIASTERYHTACIMHGYPLDTMQWLPHWICRRTAVTHCQWVYGTGTVAARWQVDLPHEVYLQVNYLPSGMTVARSMNGIGATFARVTLHSIR